MPQDSTHSVVTPFPHLSSSLLPTTRNTLWPDSPSTTCTCGVKEAPLEPCSLSCNGLGQKSQGVGVAGRPPVPSFPALRPDRLHSTHLAKDEQREPPRPIYTHLHMHTGTPLRTLGIMKTLWALVRLLANAPCSHIPLPGCLGGAELAGKKVLYSKELFANPQLQDCRGTEKKINQWRLQKSIFCLSYPVSLSF